MLMKIRLLNLQTVLGHLVWDSLISSGNWNSHVHQFLSTLRQPCRFTQMTSPNANIHEWLSLFRVSEWICVKRVLLAFRGIERSALLEPKNSRSYCFVRIIAPDLKAFTRQLNFATRNTKSQAVCKPKWKQIMVRQVSQMWRMQI